MTAPEEIFFRAVRGEEFDICELSLSSFCLKTALGRTGYVGIPAFLSVAPSATPRSTSAPTAASRGRRTCAAGALACAAASPRRIPGCQRRSLRALRPPRRAALAQLSDTSATKVTLPFVEEQLTAARQLMGSDFWSYGVAANRHVLEAFLNAHAAQGFSPRRLSVDELFHPATLETFISGASCGNLDPVFRTMRSSKERAAGYTATAIFLIGHPYPHP